MFVILKNFVEVLILDAYKNYCVFILSFFFLITLIIKQINISHSWLHLKPKNSCWEIILVFKENYQKYAILLKKNTQLDNKCNISII